MVWAGVSGSSALCEGGPRSPACGSFDHAANVFRAAVVQLVGPRAEELLYESAAVRNFVGIDLGIAPAPDETTILRFRHILEKHELGGLMLEAVNIHLEAKGIRIATGTIVDATIIAVPSSTKNAPGERDPAMHSTKKGNQWHFGLKAHIGVDAREGYVHSVAISAAHVSDVHMLPDLLHGKNARYGATAGTRARPEPSERPRRTPRT